MEVIKGQALRLRLGTEIAGNSETVVTTHVATLQMGTVPVRLEMPHSIMVGEGDSVTIAGLAGKDGVFVGYAYRNLTPALAGAHVGSDNCFPAVSLLVSGLLRACLLSAH